MGVTWGKQFKALGHKPSWYDYASMGGVTSWKLAEQNGVSLIDQSHRCGRR